MECGPWKAAYTQLVDPLRVFLPHWANLHFPWVLLKIGYPMAEMGHLNPEEDDKLTDLGEPILGKATKNRWVP